MVALKKADWVAIAVATAVELGSLATDTTSQLNVLGHNSHPLGMDGTQVGIFEEPHKVSFSSLLKSHDSRALKPEVCLEVLSDLPDKPLERHLAK